MLIPLIRSNFHVTESNTHGNRLFYFRHDVWRILTEPPLTNLKLTMFDELPTRKVRRLLSSRALGFGQIRLVPKGANVRPVMNLRRRAATMRNGKVVLGRAINFQMKPVHSMLCYEKSKQPDLLGSSLFSVGDIYPRVKSFQSQMLGKESTKRCFYFAKVDVRACFDTIPQQEVIRVIERICSEKDYRIAQHAEIKPNGARWSHCNDKASAKPSRKFLAPARAGDDSDTFEQVVNQSFARGKKGTIFVDMGAQTLDDRESLLDLLEEHVRSNVVRIGKKFFLQKRGIPQGSILSSILCNFFYADFERECLGSLRGEDALLLRMTDDFLLISTSREKATEFLQTMHDGAEAYGIQIRPEKTLVNFDCVVNGTSLNSLDNGTQFPYCGVMINMNTLEITKDRGRRMEKGRQG